MQVPASLGKLLYPPRSQPQSSAMNEVPEVLKPVAMIPQGPLWATLAIPPVLTLLPNIAIGLGSKNGGDGGLSLLIPLVMFFVILGLTIRFHAIIGQRYRGRSLVFLVSSYFLGQMIVCLALWIGSCALFFSTQSFH